MPAEYYYLTWGHNQIIRIEQTHLTFNSNQMEHFRIYERDSLGWAFGDKVWEARLRLFGNMQKRDFEYTGQRMLNMQLWGRRKRQRLQRRIMDAVKEYSSSWLHHCSVVFLFAVWWKRIQEIGWNGGRRSAVVTPEGSGRKKRTKYDWFIISITTVKSFFCGLENCCFRFS